MNMKGFVFTLDAVFALAIAAAGVSILMYAHYESALTYSAPITESAGLAQSLLQTTVAQAAQGSFYAKSLHSSGLGLAYTWPQFMGGAELSSSNPYGPYPYLLYTVTSANAIYPVVVSGSGVAAFAAGVDLYVVNASTGSVIGGYPIVTPNNVEHSPVIYKSTVIWADSDGYITAASVYNGLYEPWRVSIPAAPTTPLEIEDNYVVYCSANVMYVVSPVNGTVIASAGVPSVNYINPPAFADGEFIVTTSQSGVQNYLDSYSLSPGGLNLAWSVALSGSYTAPPALNGSAIGVGSGGLFSIYAMNGMLIKSSSGLGSVITGVAASPSYFAAETQSGVFTFSAGGTQLASFTTPTDGENSIPSIGGSMLYTIVGNTLGNLYQGYNIQNSSIIWNQSLGVQSYGQYSNVALAYGRAYVANGNRLYAFGTYPALPGDSLAQSLGNLYLNNQSSYADAMLGEIYNGSVGILLNGTYAPGLSVASFNGPSSYVSIGYGSQLYPSHITVSAWIQLFGPEPNNYQRIVDSGGSTETYTYWVNNNGVMGVRLGGATNSCSGQSQITYDPGIAANRWYHVAFTYDGTNTILYINGVPTAPTICTQTSYSGSLAPKSAPLTIGNIGSSAFNRPFNGIISDVQVYSTALRETQVSQLYSEGPFGSPLGGAGLAGWWPLDGNANDYSGYYDYGIPYNGVNFRQSAGSAVAYMPQSLLNAYQVSSATAPLILNASGALSLYNISVVSWR